MSKISYAEFREMMMDLDTPDAEIRSYLTVNPERRGAFNPRFVADSEKVEISEEELELESVMDCCNAVSRWRRQRRFKRSIQNGDQRAVLVSEGDSWFQFPCLIDEIIDHLGSDYLIWSLGAAGDTLANMAGNNAEYMRGLDRWSDRVKGFLFSAAGNDVIGSDASDNPVLTKLLKPYKDGQSPAWHIDRMAFNDTLNCIKNGYIKVIRTIRGDSRFERLPIFIHGYDYPFPYPFHENDKRNPIYADPDEWLGQPFKERGFPPNEFRRDVLIVMIDALYEMMNDLVAGYADGGIYVVNARGSMPNLDLWADEIHGTEDGFKAVAERFRTKLEAHIP